SPKTSHTRSENLAPETHTPVKTNSRSEIKCPTFSSIHSLVRTFNEEKEETRKASSHKLEGGGADPFRSSATHASDKDANQI
ncbi:hypothetical protein CDAR_10011, partial [Caerostris darwini]